MVIISLLFNEMDNDLLHAFGLYHADKIEDQINFDLSHARLYSYESDVEQDDKFAAENTLDRSCCDGGYGSSLSAIVVSVSATSDIGRC